MTYLEQEKNLKLSLYVQMLNMLNLKPSYNEEEISDDCISDSEFSSENTVEIERSTDAMYLTSNLRAVIEGSTIDVLNTNSENFYMKLKNIRNDIKFTS